jgi:hypothetical protein
MIYTLNKYYKFNFTQLEQDLRKPYITAPHWCSRSCLGNARSKPGILWQLKVTLSLDVWIESIKPLKTKQLHANGRWNRSAREGIGKLLVKELLSFVMLTELKKWFAMRETMPFLLFEFGVRNLWWTVCGGRHSHEHMRIQWQNKGYYNIRLQELSILFSLLQSDGF